jgi:hypothetical protein
MASTKGVTKGLQGTEAHAQTRLLLTLWGLGGSDVKKSELIERLKRTGEKSEDYKSVFSKLEANGEISVSGKRTQIVSLSAEGLELLQQGLTSSDFSFDRQVGVKTANFLLRWIREMGSSAGPVKTNGKATKDAIASYDEFKTVALETYDRLNRDFNLDNLVPIYRIRRDIGDRVSRSQFNEWLLKMQTDDVLQLQGGSIEDSATDKIEDSITTEINGLRCYAKRL